ncbi:F-box protein SKP2A-like [Curcuma longa]|uniref:F-box protein SKP2A-like n=1 Tax=Curcuma longa TaxID=136217 RepID=UPI003D9DEE7B
MVGGRPLTGDLDIWFNRLILSGGGGKIEKTVEVMARWKDLPMELLLRILSLVDDQTVIVASGVCISWREALRLGLTKLSLSWCKYHMNSLVQSLAPKFVKLQVLSLRQNCRSQLEDNAVEIIASYCHDLRDLDLSKSLRLSDSSLFALAHGCSHLTKLNISGCEGFSDSALAYLAMYCKNLKSLNLCGCVRAATDRALQAISCNCCKLQYLNLGWCEHVSDAGVTSLVAGCPDIRALNLCGCVQITDDSVIALANGCLHLRSLGLYYCKNITDRAMYSLANSRSKRKQGPWQDSSREQDGIVNLNVSQCTALTAAAVQAVCDSFPGLHTCLGRNSLIISGCLNLTSVHCYCAIKLIRPV